MLNRFSGILSACLLLAGLTTANAGLVIEAEATGGATNNSVAGAEMIANSSFTVDANPNIFTAADAGLGGTAVSATGVGELGSGTFDVDFWGFSMLADGYAWFDVDAPVGQATVLQLFDSSGTLIALDRNSFFDLDGNGTTEADPGSGSTMDPFIGETALTAGQYYVAISEDPNQATGGGTGTYSLQLPSFFPPTSAWTTVTGAAVGNDTFLSPGVEGQAASYNLHISQVAADPQAAATVPAPPSIALLGIGGLALLGLGWRRRRCLSVVTA